MGQEVANDVLRDFENVIWLALIFGLVGCAVWRFFASKEPEEESGKSQPPRERGVPTAQFSGADLVVLPMVLVKYSFVLVVAATFLFSLPERLFVRLGIAPESEVEKSDLESQLNETVELSPELIGLDLLLNLMLVSLVIVMIQWVGRADPSEIFGLRRLKAWKLLLWIGAGSVIALPVVQSIVVVSHLGLESIFGEGLEDQMAVQSLREAETEPLMQFLLIMQACVVAPIVEEVIFRGYLYGVLKRFTGAMFAAFIGASLFALAHNNLPAVLPLWGFAIFLTLFYEASRSLWVPIGMHAVFNIVGVFRLLESSGG